MRLMWFQWIGATCLSKPSSTCPLLANRPNCTLQINGIPQDNRADHQVEAACAVTLRLKAP